MVLCTVFSLFACSCDSSKVKLTDSTLVESTGEGWCPAVSLRGNGLIHCGSDETENDYIFEIHALHGSFLVKQEEGKYLDVTGLVIEGSGYAFWQYDIVSYPAFPSLTWRGLKTFLEVFIKKGEQYVGYAVVAVERPEDTDVYGATVLECKEVLRQGDTASGLSKQEIQEMIDKVIKKH